MTPATYYARNREAILKVQRVYRKARPNHAAKRRDHFPVVPVSVPGWGFRVSNL